MTRSHIFVPPWEVMCFGGDVQPSNGYTSPHSPPSPSHTTGFTITPAFPQPLMKIVLPFTNHLLPILLPYPITPTWRAHHWISNSTRIYSKLATYIWNSSITTVIIPCQFSSFSYHNQETKPLDPSQAHHIGSLLFSISHPEHLERPSRPFPLFTSHIHILCHT